MKCPYFVKCPVKLYESNYSWGKKEVSLERERERERERFLHQFMVVFQVQCRSGKDWDFRSNRRDAPEATAERTSGHHELGVPHEGPARIDGPDISRSPSSFPLLSTYFLH